MGNEGGSVRFKLGPAEVLFLDHPDYVKEVLRSREWNFVKGLGVRKMKRLVGDGLLTSERHLHRRQRLLAQPAFHAQRIEKYAETMAEYGRRARERWREGETLTLPRKWAGNDGHRGQAVLRCRRGVRGEGDWHRTSPS
ncbi:MAG: hypothetical protein DMG23_14585 [Acidobacteria bacterium]|nr:MAG: hypothetical protein DMG23_14585 [Acidobacteriota bacterium]